MRALLLVMVPLLLVLACLSSCKMDAGDCGVSGCAPSGDRSTTVRTEYLKSIGRYPLEPGYVVHHICPLHLGGCDVVGNLTIMNEYEHQHMLDTCCGRHFSHINSVVAGMNVVSTLPLVMVPIMEEVGFEDDEDLVCPVMNIPYDSCSHCLDEIEEYLVNKEKE